MADIRAYKLISGEEIIARVESETDDTLILSKPRALAMVPVSPGQAQLQLVPYTACDPEGDLELEKKVIAARPKHIAKELEDGYISQTSGIEIAGV